MDIRHAMDLVDAPLDEERPAPGTHVLMITGKIAKSGLERVMHAINPQDFTYEIRAMDIQVAAWLDAEMVAKEIGDVSGFGLVIVPGKVTGDVDGLTERLGVRVERGPNCYSELPVFFEEQGLEKIDDDDILRPRAAVIGSSAFRGTVAAYLAETYQIPLITRAGLVSDALAASDERAAILATYEDVPHNLMAELVRERFIDNDVKRGFVFDGYPVTPRDMQWLTDMKIGVDMYVMVDSDDEVSLVLKEALSGNPRFILVPAEENEKAVLGTVLARVEQMMQQCLTPDQGLALNK